MCVVVCRYGHTHSRCITKTVVLPCVGVYCETTIQVVVRQHIKLVHTRTTY